MNEEHLQKIAAAQARDFEVKDSGARDEWASGFQRDTQEGKPDYTLIPLEFLERWAWHMTKGAEKYGRENWRLADDETALQRFRSSAFRHLMQWLQGDRDEDHASAVAFNVAAAEYVRERLIVHNDSCCGPAQFKGEAHPDCPGIENLRSAEALEALRIKLCGPAEVLEVNEAGYPTGNVEPESSCYPCWGCDVCKPPRPEPDYDPAHDDAMRVEREREAPECDRIGGCLKKLDPFMSCKCDEPTKAPDLIFKFDGLMTQEFDQAFKRYLRAHGLRGVR